MPSPLAACHRLLTTLGGGTVPDEESARRVEAIIEQIERHSRDDLLKVAALLSATGDATDSGAALDAAKVEVKKRPKKA